MTKRRRSLLLLGLALLLGALAASDVASREAALEARLGPTVPVVVAREDLAAGKPIAARRLGVRQVPQRFAPQDAFAASEQLTGQRPAATVPAGADVTAAALARDETAAGAPVRRGERIADVVATGTAELITAGARVDVLVTRERETRLALQDVEVLQARPAEAAEQGASAPRVAASLRVTLRQAVYLAAAQAFARELRLLPRAAGDRERAGPLTDVG